MNPDPSDISNDGARDDGLSADRERRRSSEADMAGHPAGDLARGFPQEDPAAEVPDAGVSDSGVPDSGVPDSGTFDSGTFDSGVLEPELLDLARALDARGSRLARSRDGLSADALERVFAASDLQLPIAASLGLDARVDAASRAHPFSIAGRIGRGAQAVGVRRLLRIAAVVAAAAGLGLAVYAVTRGFDGGGAPLKNGTGAPQGTLAQGGGGARPDATTDLASGASPQDRADPRSPVPQLRARDLDAALSGALAARTTVRPASSAVLALSGDDRASARVAVSRAAIAAETAGLSPQSASRDEVAGAAFAGDLDEGLASLDLVPATFDELSGEFSALLAASRAPR